MSKFLLLRDVGFILVSLLITTIAMVREVIDFTMSSSFILVYLL